mmetsp:Transcript_48523/g.125908  ORF Transcript_48523/g.125908 Transcript_48523/m.125908 type:complete len:271 (-) Transcript_48523:432-1244(-)
MIYFIGLGLGDHEDITIKGLRAVKSCTEVYLDHYTSILGVDKDKLEELYERPVTLADRDMVEQDSDRIFRLAKEKNVAFLVVGDPFGATTHMDLYLRAKEEEIDVEVIHNASIMNAIGCCGLQLYRFGQTVSIPFFTDSWKPDSFYDKTAENMKLGLHTLCLLDIKVKEQTIENLMRGNKIFEPPRFMSVNQALDQFVEVEESKKENISPLDRMCVGVARVGQKDQVVLAGTVAQLRKANFGPPLHSLVICGELHEMEQEALKVFMVKDE